MNVTFLDNKIDLNSGGSSRSLDLIAQSLSERDHNVEIITLSRNNQNHVPPDVDYSVSNIEYSDQIDAVKRIYQTLNKYESKTDIFHLYNPSYIPFGGLYRKRGGSTPIVGRLNNYSMFCTNRQKMNNECYKNCSITNKFIHDRSSNIEKVARIPNYVFQSTVQSDLSNGVDRIFAISPAIKKVYTANGLNESIIKIVPNFYDKSMLKSLKIRNHTPSPPYQILYIGRLVHQKGVDLLIEMLEDIDLDVEVTIVGDGPELANLRKKVNQVRADNKVTFTGWVEYQELSNYYTSSDVFIHPGRWPEPFGRTLLEAMQYCVPPVVSNVGAPPWIVGKAGEVFEPENHTDLSRQVTKVLTNKKKYHQKREYCLERVSNFNPSKIVELIESEYHTLHY